ncbi:Nn.00g007430.m01.CDS01 [Neocucurbitaria sp. VM-36]
MATAGNSISASTDNDVALSLLHQELCNLNCADHGAKFQVFCERLWDRLQHDPPPADSILHGFVTMLQSDDNVLLAQLVIPDLRPNAAPPASPVKRKLLHQIEPGRPSLEFLRKRPQPHDTEAHRRHMEEKQRLQDADLHRACLLLYGRGNLDETQKEEVRRWLASYPKECI